MAVISQPTVGTSRPSALKTILLSWIVAGTLDILAAVFMYSIVRQNGDPAKLLRAIASGAFGKSVLTGGMKMALYGLVFHYFIAFCFALAYFLVFPYIPFLRKQKLMAGLLYGILVWIIMNLVVLPVVFSRMPPMRWDSVLIGAVTLMLCIGLPVSFITHKYYSKTRPVHVGKDYR